MKEVHFLSPDLGEFELNLFCLKSHLMDSLKAESYRGFGRIASVIVCLFQVEVEVHTSDPHDETFAVEVSREADLDLTSLPEVSRDEVDEDEIEVVEVVEVDLGRDGQSEVREGQPQPLRRSRSKPGNLDSLEMMDSRGKHPKGQKGNWF